MKGLEEAKKKAISILTRRALTEKELYEKLIAAGFENETASNALLWAREYGFVNDADYIRRYISDAINLKKYGRRRIEQALSFKGIDSFAIQDAFAELEDDEYERLTALVDKKLNGEFGQKNVDRVVRSLAAKGYEFGDIREAVRAAQYRWEAEHPDGVGV